MLAAVAGTVAIAGTDTAALLLDRFTTCPPAGAAAFSVTVQASVPEPVIEPLPQASTLTCAKPVPLRPIIMGEPVVLLLVTAS